MSQEYAALVMIMGPTAAGKSELALEVAERLRGEIISVDSAMVYRGMDIGTAKPSADERARVPHHLIDILAPHEAYSAARFCTDAWRAIEHVRARGRLPVLAGGTMLYYAALQRGLSLMPPADTRVRAQLAARAAEQGWATLHEELATIDPEAARRIHPNDPQRIQRALEVWHLTGVPLTEHHRADPPAGGDLRAVKIVLNPPERGTLHAQIERRFDAMLAAGLVDEVATLRGDARLNADTAAMRAVGYRQVWSYLAGDCSYCDMRERAIISSRQLAKRQLTWLRRETDARWFAPGDGTSAAVHEYLAEALNA